MTSLHGTFLQSRIHRACAIPSRKENQKSSSRPVSHFPAIYFKFLFDKLVNINLELLQNSTPRSKSRGVLDSCRCYCLTVSTTMGGRGDAAKLSKVEEVEGDSERGHEV